jgi:hypothetical protein
MAEKEIGYIDIDTSKRGSDSRILKALHNETIVPVIPPDPEDEVFDSTQVSDPFSSKDNDTDVKQKLATQVKAPFVRPPSTHSSRTADKYE